MLRIIIPKLREIFPLICQIYNKYNKYILYVCVSVCVCVRVRAYNM